MGKNRTNGGQYQTTPSVPDRKAMKVAAHSISTNVYNEHHLPQPSQSFQNVAAHNPHPLKLHSKAAAHNPQPSKSYSDVAAQHPQHFPGRQNAAVYNPQSAYLRQNQGSVAYNPYTTPQNRNTAAHSPYSSEKFHQASFESKGDLIVDGSIIFGNVGDSTRTDKVFFDYRHPPHKMYDRPDYMSRLKKMVREGGRKVNEHLPIISITGRAGVGKTELVRSFVRKVNEDYGNIIWMDAGTRSSLTHSFNRLAERLNVKMQNYDGTPILQVDKVNAIYDILCKIRTLLIFDQADADRTEPNHAVLISDFLPTSLHSERSVPITLITLRRDRLGFDNEKTLAVVPFTADEATLLVLKDLGMKERDENNLTQARALSLLFGCFPFAIYQAVQEVRSEQAQLMYHRNWDYRIRELIVNCVTRFNNKIKSSGVKDIGFPSLMEKFEAAFNSRSDFELDAMFSLLLKAEWGISHLTQEYRNQMEVQVKMDPLISAPKLVQVHENVKTTVAAKLESTIKCPNLTTRSSQLEIFSRHLAKNISTEYALIVDEVNKNNQQRLKRATEKGYEEFNASIKNRPGEPLWARDEFEHFLLTAESKAMAVFCSVFGENVNPEIIHPLKQSLKERKSQLLQDLEGQRRDQINVAVKDIEKRMDCLIQKVAARGYILSSRLTTFIKQFKAGARLSFLKECRRLDMQKELIDVLQKDLDAKIVQEFDKLVADNKTRRLGLEKRLQDEITVATDNFEREAKQLFKTLKSTKGTNNSTLVAEELQAIVDKILEEASQRVTSICLADIELLKNFRTKLTTDLEKAMNNWLERLQLLDKAVDDECAKIVNHGVKEYRAIVRVWDPEEEMGAGEGRKYFEVARLQEKIDKQCQLTRSDCKRRMEALRSKKFLEQLQKLDDELAAVNSEILKSNQVKMKEAELGLQSQFWKVQVQYAIAMETYLESCDDEEALEKANVTRAKEALESLKKEKGCGPELMEKYVTNLWTMLTSRFLVIKEIFDIQEQNKEQFIRDCLELGWEESRRKMSAVLWKADPLTSDETGISNNATACGEVIKPSNKQSGKDLDHDKFRQKFASDALTEISQRVMAVYPMCCGKIKMMEISNRFQAGPVKMERVQNDDEGGAGMAEPGEVTDVNNNNLIEVISEIMGDDEPTAASAT